MSESEYHAKNARFESRFRFPDFDCIKRSDRDKKCIYNKYGHGGKLHARPYWEIMRKDGNHDDLLQESKVLQYNHPTAVLQDTFTGPSPCYLADSIGVQIWATLASRELSDKTTALGDAMESKKAGRQKAKRKVHLARAPEAVGPYFPSEYYVQQYYQQEYYRKEYERWVATVWNRFWEAYPAAMPTDVQPFYQQSNFHPFYEQSNFHPFYGQSNVQPVYQQLSVQPFHQQASEIEELQHMKHMVARIVEPSGPNYNTHGASRGAGWPS
ncbi:MAG: hypothetical protein Q9226_006425 [Calogaya cf. arnoldii]